MKAYNLTKLIASAQKHGFLTIALTLEGSEMQTAYVEWQYELLRALGDDWTLQFDKQDYRNSGLLKYIKQVPK